MVGKLKEVWVRTDSDGNSEITAEQPVNPHAFDVVEHYMIATPEMIGTAVAAQQYVDQVKRYPNSGASTSSLMILVAATNVYTKSTTPGGARDAS